MDHFLEEVVVRKKGQAFGKIMYAVSWIVIVLSALMASMTLMALLSEFSVWGLVQLLLLAGIALLFLRQKDSVRSIEYEYTFTNGEMDFARVLGNSRRKHLLTLSLRDVESGGRLTSPNFARYSSMRDLKRYDYFLNNDADLAYLFFVREGNKHLMVFEPSDAMRAMIAGTNPRAISFS